MRLSQGRLEQLMAYADGELAGHERLEVEALLSENEDAREFLAQLGHLGGLVKTGWENDPRAKAVASFDIADDIMRAIGNETAKGAEVPLPPKTEKSNLRSLEEQRRARASRMKTGGIVVAFLAAAAAVALFARGPSETPIAKAPYQAAPTATAAPGTGAGPGVEVEAVESPGSSVSVFHLPGASELSTSVVVWVEETGEKP